LGSWRIFFPICLASFSFKHHLFGIFSSADHRPRPSVTKVSPVQQYQDLLKCLLGEEGGRCWGALQLISLSFPHRFWEPF
jgi:hypothetical protein